MLPEFAMLRLSRLLQVRFLCGSPQTKSTLYGDRLTKLIAKLLLPNQIALRKVIATSAAAVGHYALKVAPDAAVSGSGSADRVLATIRRRLSLWWPELVV